MSDYISLALFIAYLGEHYHGVQHQTKLPMDKTVQGAVGLVLFDCGLASLHSNGTKLLSRHRFVVTSRTDRGVHSLGNAMRVFCHRRAFTELSGCRGVLRALNAALAKRNIGDITVLGVSVIPPSMDLQLMAIGRIYQYLIPSWVLQSNGDTKSVEELAAKVESMMQIFTSDQHSTVQTHSFHNYSVDDRVRPGSGRANRIIWTCRAVPHLIALNHTENVSEFVLVRITGRSFLPGMIRKMIGIIIACTRNVVSMSMLKESLNPQKLVDIPLAPGGYLWLDQILFVTTMLSNCSRASRPRALTWQKKIEFFICHKLEVGESSAKIREHRGFAFDLISFSKLLRTHIWSLSNHPNPPEPSSHKRKRVKK